jgi:hypothetical protein
LRQLRRCDGKVSWVDKGKTTVPREQRNQLLEKVMYVLFEGKHSLLHLEKVDENLAESDDIARLKGLLIWLAWDCGVRFRFTGSFMEPSEDQKARLVRNAIMLALLQAIRGDQVVIDEATECIGGLSSGELDWLTGFLAAASQIELLRDGMRSVPPASEVNPGDLAIPAKATSADLRIVSHFDGNSAWLIALDGDKPERRFLANHLHFIKCSDIPWQ